VEKIVEVDYHMGAAMSGLVADARILVDKARVEVSFSIFGAQGSMNLMKMQINRLKIMCFHIMSVSK
jgi:20S proteasome alpha/beta subunit